MQKNQLIFLIIILIFGAIALFILFKEREEKDKPFEIQSSQEKDEVSLTEEYSEKIIGEWKSKEDEKSVVLFKEDETFKDIYDKEEVSSGEWVVKDKKGNFDITFHLYKTVEGEEGEDVYEYEITRIDEENLSLVYLERGNVLEYEKITSN